MFPALEFCSLIVIGDYGHLADVAERFVSMSEALLKVHHVLISTALIHFLMRQACTSILFQRLLIGHVPVTQEENNNLDNSWKTSYVFSMARNK